MAARREERPSRAFRRTRRYKTGVASVGAAVRHLRSEAGWTLEKAAERMGLDFRHLQQIEAGTVNLTLVTVLRIADAFGVPPGQILPGAARPDPAGRTNLEYGLASDPQATKKSPKGRAKRIRKARPSAVETYLPNPIPEPASAESVQAGIGSAVARFRRAKLFTQRALAKKLGVSTQYVQRVEAGKQNFTIRSLVRFANALGVKPKHLLSLD